MLDKPISAKIILALIDKSYDGYKFIGLSTALYHQRLIFDEPRELRKANGNLELTVNFVDTNSFDNWLKHPKVIEHWSEDFEKFLIGKPKTVEQKNVIVEIDKVFNCSCSDSKFFLLQGRAFGFSPELTCGSCSGSVPYSRVPLSIKIEQWQTYHQRIYLNWLDSGILESSALRQLKNYKNGKLNLEGDKIRKELSEYFKKPVYMEYFVEETDIRKTCVICGGKGIKSELKRPKRLCKKCYTAFDYSDID